MKHKSVFALVILLLLVTGCGRAGEETPEPLLTFAASLQAGEEETFHISLEAHNQREEPFPGNNAFNGVMVLNNAAGEMRARAEIATLPLIEPGESVFPVVWSGLLRPGSYQLIWGANGYGHTVVSFSIVEQNSGPYIDEEVHTQQLAEDPPVTPNYGVAQPAVEKARQALQQRLDVPLEAVRVQSIDAVPPSSQEAELIQTDTDSELAPSQDYLIRLQVEDTVYSFEGRNEEVAFAPDEQGEIAVAGVQIVGNQLQVNGRTTLPNNTCLQTQLLANEQPVSWWPVMYCVPTAEGTWQITILMELNGVPFQLAPQNRFQVRAWKQDEPWIQATPFWFEVADTPPE